MLTSKNKQHNGLIRLWFVLFATDKGLCCLLQIKVCAVCYSSVSLKCKKRIGNFTRLLDLAADELMQHYFT